MTMGYNPFITMDLTSGGQKFCLRRIFNFVVDQHSLKNRLNESKEKFRCEGVMQRRTGKRRMRADIDGVVKQN